MGKKISELNEAIVLGDSDLLEVVQSAENKKISFKNFMDSTVLRFLTVSQNINLNTISDNLQTAFDRLKGISFAAAVPSEADINKKTDHTSSLYPIRYDQPQDIEHMNQLELMQSRELITVANAFKIELALKALLENEIGDLSGNIEDDLNDIRKNIVVLPTADGEYKLKIENGVASWVSA